MTQQNCRSDAELTTAVLTAWNAMITSGIPPTQKRLYKATGVRPQWLGTILNNLEKAGLITRRKTFADNDPTEDELLDIEAAKEAVKAESLKRRAAQADAARKTFGRPSDGKPKTGRDLLRSGRVRRERTGGD